MDEDEIDLWYEDEKQKAVDEYMKELESKKNNKEAETAFNAKMDALMKKYNQLMTEKIANRGKSSRFRGILENMTDKIRSFRK